MLNWNFSAIVAYTNNTWTSVEIRENSNGSYVRGPDLSQHPEIIELLTKLGITPKTAVIDETISSVTFRFSATYYNTRISIASGVDESPILSENLSAVIEQLQSSELFSSYFLSDDNDFSYNITVEPYTLNNFYGNISLTSLNKINNEFKFNRDMGSPMDSRMPRSRNISTCNNKLYYITTINFDIYTSCMMYTFEDDEMIALRIIPYVSGNFDTAVVDSDGVIWAISGQKLLKIAVDNTVTEIESSIYNGLMLYYIEEGTDSGLYTFDQYNLRYSRVNETNGDLTEVGTYGVPGSFVVNQISNVSYVGQHLINAITTRDISGVSTRKYSILTINESNELELVLDLPYRTHQAILSFENVIPPSFYIIGDEDSPLSRYMVYKLSDEIISLTQEQSYDSESFAAAFNHDDNYIYVLKFNNEVNPKLYKIDSLLSPPAVEIENYDNDSIKTQSYISDGGNDMYDNANIISTNLSKVVEWTHSQQVNPNSSGGSFVEIADGVVVVGDNEFGPDSSYFTNMYSGLFVLVATDISINSFKIDGNIGADGSGFVENGSFDITNNASDYTVYYKRVYGASSDPSINQLIIIPKTNGITQLVAPDTRSDYHELIGLNNCNKLYYLLYATANGGKQEESDYQSVVSNFFTKLDSATDINDILDNLNSSTDSIVGDVEGLYLFTDHSENWLIVSPFTDDYDFNMYMTYIGNDTFFCVMGDTAFEINTNGDIELKTWLPPTDLDLDINDLESFTWLYGDLYCVTDEDDPQFLKIDKETGEILEQHVLSLDLSAFDTEYDTGDGFGVNGIVIGEDLKIYANVYYDNNVYYCEFNLDEFSLTAITRYSNIDDLPALLMGPKYEYDTLGFSTLVFRFFSAYLTYNTGTISVNIPMFSIPNENPVAENYRFQYAIRPNLIQLNNVEWTTIEPTGSSISNFELVCDFDEPNTIDDNNRYDVVFRIQPIEFMSSYWIYASND